MPGRGPGRSIRNSAAAPAHDQYRHAAALEQAPVPGIGGKAAASRRLSVAAGRLVLVDPDAAGAEVGDPDADGPVQAHPTSPRSPGYPGLLLAGVSDKSSANGRRGTSRTTPRRRFRRRCLRHPSQRTRKCRLQTSKRNFGKRGQTVSVTEGARPAGGRDIRHPARSARRSVTATCCCEDLFGGGTASLPDALVLGDHQVAGRRAVSWRGAGG